MNIFVLKSEEIAAITRATHGNPHHILGMHECLDDCYVNAFLPGVAGVSVMDGDQEYPMQEIGSQGFFSVKISGRAPFAYKLKVTRKVWGQDGETDDVKVVYDPYSFEPSVDLFMVMKVVDGDDDIETGFHVKELFGARRCTLDGVEGVSFCMNMPGAVRVSVVGDFNDWDGRVNPMRRIDYTDIFELFIPGDLTGNRYKFEALYRDGNVDIFADPYAVAYEVAPGNASLLTELEYSWKDSRYMENRRCTGEVNIYEVHMPTWKAVPDDGKLSYEEFGREISAYAKNMGYSHVQFMPLMEYGDDNGWGYDTKGMFAPTSRFGTPIEFMAMVDQMHSRDIGVIMDMVTVNDIDCLSYWIDTYHLDGIRLEDEELVHEFRKLTGDKYADVYVGLSWNNEAVTRVTDYMMIPPASRGSFADYTCGIEFDEADSSVWALSHDLVAGDRGSYAAKMPGGYEDKYADLRILFGLIMTLPGRKLTFMGQELGGFDGFNGRNAIDWSVLEFDANSYFQKYVKEINKLYNTREAMHGSEPVSKPDGGHTAVDLTEQGQLVSFVRHGKTAEDALYIVCNFGLKDVHDYELPVVTDGRFREIFSSDSQKFGGEGHNNKGYRTAENGMIRVEAPALSFAVFAHVSSR